LIGSVGVAMIRTVIFDWDGVIADSTEIHHEFMKYCCASLNKNYPFKTKEEFIMSNPPPYPQFYYNLGFTEEDLKKQGVMFKVYMINQKIPLVKGIVDVLYKFRKNGYKIGLVTSNVSNIVENALKQNGVGTDVFNSIIDINRTKKLKPDPEPLILCLKKLNETPQTSAYVGDLESDIHAAKAAGMKSIGVTWGWGTKERLIAAKADFIVNKPMKLIDVIKKL
jgi:pyrophosphatase PpaX